MLRKRQVCCVCSLVVQHLPSICETLSSLPSTAQIERKARAAVEPCLSTGFAEGTCVEPSPPKIIKLNSVLLILPPSYLTELGGIGLERNCECG
jgi:hypothetical protein